MIIPRNFTNSAYPGAPLEHNIEENLGTATVIMHALF